MPETLQTSPVPSPGPRLLVIMRHAKSSWADSSMDDHSRPLNDRGRKSAPVIAEWLTDNSLVPDVILCSSAVRTQQTSDLIRSYWEDQGLSGYVQQDCPELYLASPNAILACLAQRGAIQPIPQKILLLGHNPGSEILASMLSGQAITMATAACVVFEIDSMKQPRWNLDLHSGGIKKINQICPKEI